MTEGFNTKVFDKIDASHAAHADTANLLPAYGERPSPMLQHDANSYGAGSAVQRLLHHVELIDDQVPTTEELYPAPRVGAPSGRVPGSPSQTRDLRPPSSPAEAEQFELRGITNTVENENRNGLLLFEAKQYLIKHDQDPLRYTKLERALSQGGMSKEDIEHLEGIVRQRDPNEHSEGHRDIPGTVSGIL
jgi:hypothetical protein